MEHNQLTFGNSLNVLGHFSRELAVEQLLNLFILEAPNHNLMISLKDTVFNGYYFVSDQ